MDELMQNSRETKNIILTNRLDVLLCMIIREWWHEVPDTEVAKVVNELKNKPHLKAQISLIKELL